MPQINESLQTVYPFIKKWVEGKGIKNEELSEQGWVRWGNEFIEYQLYANVFQCPMLRAYSVEIRRELIFLIPVPEQEEAFVKLMELLDK